MEKYVLGMFQTNCYVLTNELNQAVIIDPGQNFESVYYDIVDNFEVKAILLTHGHLDHVDGIHLFKDTPIYLAKLEKDVIFDETLSLYKYTGLKMPYNPNKMNFIYLNDLEEFDISTFHFKMLLTPGHTKGSACYLYKDKLFTGDTLFHLSVGRTDFPTGDMKKLMESLNKLVKLVPDSTKCYPGHDEKTDIKTERKDNPYLKR